MEHVTAGGAEIPALGLGTYKLRGDPCLHAVREALSLGYRHIDTAEIYGNHAQVGEAIAGAEVDRDEVFLTTKVWRTNLRRNQVIGAVDDSLDDLGVEYVDLLLVHWPNDEVPVEETIGAMNRLQEEGLVRHVGVSNFSVAELRGAMEASRTPIVTDQVRYHPFHDQDDLREFCADNGIVLTAYSPLAKGDVAGDPTLTEIGEGYGKSAAQVALRWLLQQDGVIAIPKAAGRDHLRENIDVFDFTLSDGEMERISALA